MEEEQGLGREAVTQHTPLSLRPKPYSVNTGKTFKMFPLLSSNQRKDYILKICKTCSKHLLVLWILITAISNYYLQILTRFKNCPLFIFAVIALFFDVSMLWRVWELVTFVKKCRILAFIGSYLAYSRICVTPWHQDVSWYDVIINDKSYRLTICIKWVHGNNCMTYLKMSMINLL